MAKKLLIAVLLLTLCATPALAAKGMTKAFKISVHMPSAIEMPNPNISSDDSLDASFLEFSHWQTTETIILAADNQKILLRTTVIR